MRVSSSPLLTGHRAGAQRRKGQLLLARVRHRALGFESLESRAMLSGQPAAALSGLHAAKTTSHLGQQVLTARTGPVVDCDVSTNQAGTGFGSSSTGTTPPTVLGVYVSGHDWSLDFLADLQASGLGSAS